MTGFSPWRGQSSVRSENFYRYYRNFSTLHGLQSLLVTSLHVRWRQSETERIFFPSFSPSHSVSIRRLSFSFYIGFSPCTPANHLQNEDCTHSPLVPSSIRAENALEVLRRRWQRGHHVWGTSKLLS